MNTKVLILEDSKTQAVALADILNKAGFTEVQLATTVEEALRLSKEVDVVLCDLYLPDSEGEATIKTMVNGCALVAVSDHIKSENIDLLFDAGAHLVLPKKDLLTLSEEGLKAVIIFAKRVKQALVKKKARTVSLLRKIDEIVHGSTTS